VNRKHAIKLTASTAVLALAIWTAAAAQGGWQVLAIAALTLIGILLFGLWGDIAIGALIFALWALLETGAQVITRTPTWTVGRAARQLIRPRTGRASATPSPTP